MTAPALDLGAFLPPGMIASLRDLAGAEGAPVVEKLDEVLAALDTLACRLDQLEEILRPVAAVVEPLSLALPPLLAKYGKRLGIPS